MDRIQEVVENKEDAHRFLLCPFLRSFLFTLGSLLLLGAAFLAGYAFHSSQERVSKWEVLNEAYQILSHHGEKALPPDPALEYGMIRGMLQAYNDPYAAFIEPVEHELHTNQLEGNFGGIGAAIEKDGDGHWLLYPVLDSPAEKAGVQPGDRLLAVETLVLTGETSLDAILAAIRGPVGESVSLKIARAPDYQAVVLKIKRGEISLASVTWRVDPQEPRLGLLKVGLISASTTGEISRAIEQMKAKGATHFVLDFRHNPGGYLTAGVDIARLFLASGEVLQQQYKNREVETYRVEKPGPFSDLPLVVLIGKDSASAAEIAAGALQANRRAKLIGEPSFGKDTIQLVFDLSDRSSLHVTAAHWWIPGQAPIGGLGLQPDIPAPAISEDGQADACIQAARAYFFSTGP